MAPKMTIRIDPEIKDSFSKFVRAEGKSASEVLRELIEDYVKERDIRTYVDDLWIRIGGKLRSKGLGQRGINRAIKEVRKSRGCYPKSDRR